MKNDIKIRVLREKLIAAGAACGSVEPFNTNNAWGFGGGIGEHFSCKVGDRVYDIRKGTAYFRHAKPQRFFIARGTGAAQFMDPEKLLCSLQGEVAGK